MSELTRDRRNDFSKSCPNESILSNEVSHSRVIHVQRGMKAGRIMEMATWRYEREPIVKFERTAAKSFTFSRGCKRKKKKHRVFFEQGGHDPTGERDDASSERVATRMKQFRCDVSKPRKVEGDVARRDATADFSTLT